MNDKQYVVYQHRNAINNEVFYIGSGNLKRGYQVAPQQRSITWNLYVKNNNLRLADAPLSSQSFLNTGQILVDILVYCDTKEQAYKGAIQYIHSVYGMAGYKLTNTLTTEKTSNEHYKRMAKHAIQVLSRPVINLIDNKHYNSSSEAAKLLNRNYTTINYQCRANHKKLLKFESKLISTVNGMFIFEEDLELYRKTQES